MGYRILIVDTDELLRRSLRTTLESVGFEVELAHGEDAMDVLDARPIDLVLTERLLRDTDGLSLLWCIKGMHPELPVIVMAHESAFPAILDAMRFGADDYLVKPFDKVTLLRSIHRAINSTARVFRPPADRPR